MANITLSLLFGCFKKAVTVYVVVTLFTGLAFGQQIPNKRIMPWESVTGRHELTEKRDRTTKHFMNPDGSRSAFISAGSIHFNDGKAWCEIDNDIVAHEGNYSGTHPYCNKNNSFSNYFPADLFASGIITKYNEIIFNERIVSIDFVDVNGDILSSLSFDQNVAQTSVEDHVIRYSFTADNVEFSYSLHNDRRKFDMRILSPAFLQAVPHGAVALVIREEVVVNESVEISYDNKGVNAKAGDQNILRYAAPVCNDASTSSPFGGTAGSISAQVKDGVIYIESAFLIDWITSPARVFPLNLDPVVDYLPDSIAGWTGTQKSIGTSVFGPLSVRDSLTDYRAWAKFNISSLPAYATLFSAKYYGYHYQGSNTDVQQAVARRLIVDPAAVTDTMRWNAIIAGSQFSGFFAFGENSANYGWKSVSLNGIAVGYIDSVKTQGWFALGFNYMSGGTTQAYHYGYTASTDVCYLQVDYTEECTGTPQGGNAGVSGVPAIVVCEGDVITLEASGYSEGPQGLSHIWQTASTGTGPWSGILGATADTHTVVVTANVFFRYNTDCSFSGLDASTNVVSVTVLTPPVQPAGIGDTVSCGQAATLTATGSSGKYLWFEDTGGTQLAGTGTAFVTPVLYADETYYLAATTADISLIGTEYEFTNCGASGRIGPTPIQVASEYAGTTLDGAVTITGDGVQVWEVPYSGTYRIAAYGAQGGNNGGRGAMTSGDFDLTAGQKLHVLVGQKGSSGYFALNKIYASGGGGTNVMKEGVIDETGILLVAGGGGGLCPATDTVVPAGNITADGSNGYGFSGGKAGGTFGNGGTGTNNFGGGGGFSTDAFYDGPAGTSGGKGYLNGGAGGFGSFVYIDGGFGGGGGVVQPSNSFRYAAGGGGYSGGGAAYSTDSLNYNNGAAAGGGGSFNNGNNQDNQQGINAGHGSVTITLTLPAGCLSSPLLPVQANVIEPTAPSVSDTTVDCGQSVLLIASGSTGNYVWYSDSLGTSIVGTGPSFQTPSMQSTTTYYVAASSVIMSGTGLTYNFSNCGAEGNAGPSQQKVDSSYAGTALDADVNAIGSGIQQWTVPATGTYEIEVLGAEGGKNPLYYVVPGKGARMKGKFNMNTGEVLRILVGQQGGVNGSSYGGQGGGGGSYVTKQVGASPYQMFDGIFIQPLIVAGGGAGAPNSSAPYPLDGRTDTRGSGFVSAGSLNPLWAGGGGSLTVNGGGDASLRGYSFLSGGLGSSASWAVGGFGGGGGKGDSTSYAGGGGGFDGGDYVNTGGANTANGGGSFNSGYDQDNEAGINTSHGSVVIKSLLPQGCLSELVTVTVTVNPLPDPVASGVMINCGQTAALAASGSPSDYTWFADSTGNIVAGSGTLFLTPELYHDTTFYVASTNAACTSNLVPVFVDVDTYVATPSANGATMACGISAILSASGSTLNYLWFSDSLGNNVVGAGPTFQTPLLSTTTTYYVAATTAILTGPGLEYYFSNCGQSGRTGPTQFKADSAYTGTSLDGEVTIIGDGIQRWTVPSTSTYRIEACGAEGGKHPTYFALPGKGAGMAGNFELDSGDVIRIIVGQRGGVNGSSYGGQGGGGGSFVVKQVSSSSYQMYDGIFVDPLIVAGGGAGAPNSSSWYPVDARTDTRGHNYVSAGNSNTNGGGGGGSFSVNGGGATTLKGLSFLSGGLGGAGTWAYGGFGCGGSKGGSFADGAGGGGFDGGDYVDAGGTNTANGGGSFNAGNIQNNQPGINANHGDVKISNLIARGCLSELVPVVAEVIPIPPPIVSNNSPICESDTLQLSVVGGLGVIYAWTGPDGFTSSLQNPVVSNSATPAMSGTYTLTITAGICSNTDTTNALVNATLPAGVTITANPPGGICTGDSVTFTALPVNGGNTPMYTWYLNGSPAGNNSGIFTITNPSHGNQVYCVMNSSLECVSGSPATSNTIILTVASSLPAGVIIASNPPSPVCAGSLVTFTATPINGGATPSYQWFRNGMSVGGNSSTYSTSALNNGDQIYCIMASSLTCATGSPVTSSVLVMTVNPSPPASITVSSNPAGAICYGENVVFTAVATNGGSTPAYQWYLNGVSAGSNSSAYSNNALNGGDQVYCVMTSSLVCVSASPATSDTIVMTVLPNLPAGVSLAANPPGAICAGQGVVFTATPVNGGTTPLYQWVINGIPLGSSSTYTGNNLNNGDEVYCIMTSSLTCVSGSPVFSDTISVTVNPLPLVELGQDTTICENHSFLLDAGAGIGYSYIWSDGSGGQTLLVDGTLTGTGTWPFGVQVSNSYHCEQTDTIYVTVDLCTALADRSNYGTAYFFPNPVDDILHVFLQNKTENDIDVLLTDIAGRLIYHKNHTGTYSLQINMKNLLPGIYVLEVTCGNEKFIGKVMKNQ